jgi:CheY-like chemotaxis protein
MEAVWVALVVFGFLLIVFLVLAFRFPDELKELLRRTKSVSITPKGLVLELVEKAVEEKEHRKPAPNEVRPVLERIPPQSRVLWVDDAPSNNRLEIQALRALDVDVDTATSNDEAVLYATADGYDLVLSDIGRAPPQESNAGLALPALLHAAGLEVPIAYYVGHAESPQTPDGHPVFDRPTDLLEFIAETLGDHS